jgi:hypothetical protein
VCGDGVGFKSEIYMGAGTNFAEKGTRKISIVLQAKSSEEDVILHKCCGGGDICVRYR